MRVSDIADIDSRAFEHIAWSRPENNAQASKVCLLGGSSGHFARLSTDFTYLSQDVGIKLTLITPNSLQPILKNLSVQTIYLPSHPNGGYFIKDGQYNALDSLNAADANLLSGDMGRSSETQQFLEYLLSNIQKPTVISQESLDSLASTSLPVIAKNVNTTFTIDGSAFQKIVKACRFDKAYTSGLPFRQKIDLITNFTQIYSCNFIILDDNFTFIAQAGDVYYTSKLINLHQFTLDFTKWLSWNRNNPTLTASYIASHT